MTKEGRPTLDKKKMTPILKRTERNQRPDDCETQHRARIHSCSAKRQKKKIIQSHCKWEKGEDLTGTGARSRTKRPNKRKNLGKGCRARWQRLHRARSTNKMQRKISQVQPKKYEKEDFDLAGQGGGANFSGRSLRVRP